MKHGVKIRDIKNAVGMSIFLIPQSNAVRKDSQIKKQIEKVVLIKCGSKKARVDNSFIGSFYINGELDSNDYGYLPFLKEEDAINYLEKKEFIFELKHMDLMHLDINDINKIKKIIKKEESNER